MRENRVVLVAASDEKTAAALLTTALAEIPDGSLAEVSRITAEQQWADGAVVDAGLELHVHGAFMTRGRRPPAPYIPHGALA